VIEIEANDSTIDLELVIGAALLPDLCSRRDDDHGAGRAPGDVCRDASEEWCACTVVADDEKRRSPGVRKLDEAVGRVAVLERDVGTVGFGRLAEHPADGIGSPVAVRDVRIHERQLVAVREISRDVLQINQGTLYPALHRMERAGWIVSGWRPSENNRRAKYYELTKAGRQQLSIEREHWANFARAVADIMATT